MPELGSIAEPASLTPDEVALPVVAEAVELETVSSRPAPPEPVSAAPLATSEPSPRDARPPATMRPMAAAVGVPPRRFEPRAQRPMAAAPPGPGAPAAPAEPMRASADGEEGAAERTATAPQLRRFIKSRAYVPMHELRRRFAINGADDEVTPVDLERKRVFVGLPEREGRLLGELLRAGDIGYELSLDPITPIVVGVYPMRPVTRT
jgi:hypothetical protein